MSIFNESVLHQKTPQELTALLYEACINNLEVSLEAINDKDFELVNLKLQKVNDILHRLGAGISYEKGGIIADQLDHIYNYLAERIILANLHKDENIIKEVLNIMSMIFSAWNEAIHKNQDAAPIHVRKRNMAYEQNVFTESRN